MTSFTNNPIISQFKKKKEGSEENPPHNKEKTMKKA